MSLILEGGRTSLPPCRPEVADAPKPLWRRRERSDEGLRICFENSKVARADPSPPLSLKLRRTGRSELALSWRASLEQTEQILRFAQDDREESEGMTGTVERRDDSLDFVHELTTRDTRLGSPPGPVQRKDGLAAYDLGAVTGAGGQIETVARFQVVSHAAGGDSQGPFEHGVAFLLRVLMLGKDSALAIGVDGDFIAFALENIHHPFLGRWTVGLFPTFEADLGHAASRVAGRKGRRVSPLTPILSRRERGSPPLSARARGRGSG